jgi:4-aminobutyrate aminotransferase-like enzyme
MESRWRSPQVSVLPPGPTSRLYLEKERGLFYKSWYGVKDVPFIARRKRDWIIEDVDGNRYIDMVTGWASTPLGAVHKEITQTVVDALWESGVECTDYVTFETLFPLAERLVDISPRRLTRVAPDTTGTEAVEAAVRLMREASGRPFVITFHGGFHGGNYGTGSAGAVEPSVTRGVKQFIVGYLHAPYPYCYRCPFKLSYPDCDLWCLDYIENGILRYETSPDEIAGLLIEPVEGEAGVIVPPDEYFPRLRALCDKYDWFLCADEVQTGFGRTGKMFAMEHWAVEPDIMPLAKGLSGGVLPLAAVLGSERLIANSELYLGGTFAWHPAACAGALKCIEIIERDKVLEHVTRLEAFATDRLNPLIARYQIVGDVRIKGLYIALEFVKEKDTKIPAPELTQQVHRACIQHGLVPVHEEGLWWLRLYPALNMPQETFGQGCDILEEAIHRVSRENGMGIAP